MDRLDQPRLPLDGIFGQRYTVAHVRVVVIDTGVRATHAEFGELLPHGAPRQRVMAGFSLDGDLLPAGGKRKKQVYHQEGGKWGGKARP